MSGNMMLFHAVWFPFAAAFLCYLTGRWNKALRDRLLQLSVIAEMGIVAIAAASYFTSRSKEFFLEGVCIQGLYIKRD